MGVAPQEASSSAIRLRWMWLEQKASAWMPPGSIARKLAPDLNTVQPDYIITRFIDLLEIL